jgi:hypothetical protein
MRFLITLLCMGAVVMAAVVFALVDVVMKLLPLLIAALVAVVAVRSWERRRHRAPATAGARSAVVNVPGEAAFAAHPPTTLDTPRSHLATGAYRHAGVSVPDAPDGWVMVPVWRGSAPHRQQHTVIDAEVISEDEHRG